MTCGAVWAIDWIRKQHMHSHEDLNLVDDVVSPRPMTLLSIRLWLHAWSTPKSQRCKRRTASGRSTLRHCAQSMQTNQHRVPTVIGDRHVYNGRESRETF